MSARLWPLSEDKGRGQLAGLMGQWEEAAESCGPLPFLIKAAPPSQVSPVPEKGVEHG